MTIQQFEYIVALDTFRHFVKAAESCFVTQPTLTMQVRKLEDELGFPIFDRERHPVVPTKAGARVIERARRILREVHNLHSLVHDERENMQGHYRIGIIPTIAPYLLPLFIKNFALKYPEVDLQIEEIQTSEIVKRIKEDTLDIGIIATEKEDDALIDTSVFEESFYVYTSVDHPFYGKKKVKTEEIDGKGLWILSQGHCFRDQVLNLCRKNKAKSAIANLHYEGGSLETLKRLVQKHAGYTLLPELAVIDELDSANVIPIVKPHPSRPITIVSHVSFTKEALVKKLKEEILDSLPQFKTTKD